MATLSDQKNLKPDRGRAEDAKYKAFIIQSLAKLAQFYHLNYQ